MSQAAGEVLTMQSGRKRVSVDEHSMNDISFSRDSTRQKINDKRSVDTIFECQYGKQVFESRLALMSRWTWFKDVLSTGNADVTWVAPLLKVRLPEIASCTLQFVLDFLYTGKVPQLNVVQAVDVIRACKSKYFHGELPKLEETAMKFLEWKLLTSYGGSFKAALELSLVEFRTLADASSPSRIEILSQTRLGPVHFRQLSENALRLYLDNTKSTTFFGEYLRFRQIIVWCATQACPAKEDRVIDALVPDQPQVTEYLKTFPSRRTESFDFEDLMSLLTDHQRCAAGLLEKVNFMHIPSELLDAVVEPLVAPLKLVSEERMKEAYKKAYRFHALQRTPEPPKYIWEHRGLYCTDGDGSGSVIAKSKRGMGLARYPVPIFRNHGVYEWAIVLENLCPGFCEIGFIIEPAELDGMWAYQRTLSTSRKGYCLKITPRTARINQLGHCYNLWTDFQKDFGRLNAHVKFRLDLNKHACSIAINDDKYLPAWDGLPSDHDALFFPAVCLGMEAGGQIRIKLMRGFGMV